MTGLLYKDFISTKSKYFLFAILAVTCLLLVLALSSGTDILSSVLCGTIAMFSSVTLLFAVSSSLTASLFSKDEKKNCKAYLLSLPVSKKEYVASKYLYLLIAYYAVISVSVFWSQIYNIAPVSEEIAGISRMVTFIVNGMAVLVPIAMIGSAIEFPLFVLYGKKTGDRIRTAFLMLICFLILLFLFFGDLNIMEKINLAQLIIYCNSHPVAMLIMSILSPCVSGLLYYFSYKITVHIFEKREVTVS